MHRPHSFSYRSGEEISPRVRIVRYLAEAGGAARLPDAARGCGWEPSTLRKSIPTLEEGGVLHASDGTRTTLTLMRPCLVPLHERAERAWDVLWDAWIRENMASAVHSDDVMTQLGWVRAEMNRALRELEGSGWIEVRKRANGSFAVAPSLRGIVHMLHACPPEALNAEVPRAVA